MNAPVLTFALAAAVLITLVGRPAVAAAAGHESLQRIEAAAVRLAAGHLPPGAQIAAHGLDRRLRLARCATPPVGTRLVGRLAGGAATVEVRCLADAGWTLYVPVRAHVEESVVVLRRAVAAGQTLTAADITTQRRRDASGGYGVVREAEAAIGRVARRHLPAGTVVTPQMIETADVIARGQTVTVVARAAGIEIRGRGEALQAGAPRALIRVRNAASGRVVEGRVQTDGSVLVP